MIRSRCGKAAPASVSSGRASAAASDTAPRIPIQEMITGACHGGYGSRSLIRLKRRRGT